MNREKTAAFEKLVERGYPHIAGIAVRQGGEVLYEKYFQACAADSRFHVYSVTKSVVSILIGIALDKGCIESVTQSVWDFFPDEAGKGRRDAVRHATLENLLTMTAPYAYRAAPYIRYFTSGDGVAFSLDLLGGRGKIGTFRYTPLIGPDILTGILVKATGRPVLDFAVENLFSPLGIAVEKSLVFQSKEEQLAFNKADHISGWVADDAGTQRGGWGLTLSPTEMAKLGQLYLNRGVWRGTQVVSAAWIDESTREHSRWKKRGMAYGYLWWVFPDGFAAMGDGGNVLYVNPKKELVVAVAAYGRPRVKDSMALIRDHLLPLLESRT